MPWPSDRAVTNTPMRSSKAPACASIMRAGAGGRRASTLTGRFEPTTRHIFDDGWNTLEDLPPFKTEVQTEKPRTIITRNDSPDISFERSINPYRGCEHGCVYCFARPTHSYMGMSPGLDFEARLFAKPDAAKLLERELSKPGYTAKTIAIGTNTDPYQPIEKTWRIMREILEVLEAHRHPVGIVTKSALGHARHRHPVAHGGEGARQGRAFDHHARRQARPRDGAAGGDAGAKAAGHAGAARGRHSRVGHGGSHDPRPQRP